MHQASAHPGDRHAAETQDHDPTRTDSVVQAPGCSVMYSEVLLYDLPLLMEKNAGPSTPDSETPQLRQRKLSAELLPRGPVHVTEIGLRDCGHRLSGPCQESLQESRASVLVLFGHALFAAKGF